MSYNSMLESTSAKETTKISEILKSIEIQTNTTCKLPQCMSPSQEDFESLGFTFEDIGDNEMYGSSLPNGWTIQQAKDCLFLVDEKNRKRGHIFYLNSYIFMDLFRRFSINQHIVGKSFLSPYKVFVGDFDGTCIFEAGKSTFHYDALVSKAEDYLNTNYPEWKDPLKYWD